MVYLYARQRVGRVEVAQLRVVVRLQVQQALQPGARQPREHVVTHVPAHHTYISFISAPRKINRFHFIQ